MKVLVSAYACEPDKGSEPGVGWNWVEQITRHHTVWVLTRRNNRTAIERALQLDPKPNVHWVYLDLPAWATFWKRGQRGVHVYYYLWQLLAYVHARRLHRAVHFDVIHHVTFVTYWMPSFLALLPVPFVWGPVGGGESAPNAFLETFTTRGRRFEHARELARWFGEHDAFVRQTARRAASVLATTPETAARVRRLGAENVQILSQVALTAADLARLGRLTIRTDAPFRVVSVGRLVDWKGTHLALRAFAELHQRVPASEYWIVGDGPVRVHLEEVVQRLGLESAVVFKGWVPRDRLLDTFGECDVAVHPSLHESGGWVCAEAMAAGRPVICLALGGPGLQLTASTGFAISAATADAAVEAMGVALVRLASDFALRRLMGEAARDRVARAYRWHDRGEFIDALYAAVTASPTEPRSVAIHSRSVLASSRSSEGAGAPYDGC